MLIVVVRAEVPDVLANNRRKGLQLVLDAHLCTQSFVGYFRRFLIVLRLVVDRFLRETDNEILSCLDSLLVYRVVLGDAVALFKGLSRSSNLFMQAGQFASCFLNCAERFLRGLRAVLGRFCVRAFVYQ